MYPFEMHELHMKQPIFLGWVQLAHLNISPLLVATRVEQEPVQLELAFQKILEIRIELVMSFESIGNTVHV